MKNFCTTPFEKDPLEDLEKSRNHAEIKAGHLIIMSIRKILKLSVLCAGE